jgi:hypothetical protein
MSKMRRRLMWMRLLHWMSMSMKLILLLLLMAMATVRMRMSYLMRMLDLMSMMTSHPTSVLYLSSNVLKIFQFTLYLRQWETRQTWIEHGGTRFGFWKGGKSTTWEGGKRKGKHL